MREDTKIYSSFHADTGHFLLSKGITHINGIPVMKDETLILYIERILLHFGHEEWKKGHAACKLAVDKAIKETFHSQTEKK